MLTVRFDGGASANLDMRDPKSQVWADVLDSRKLRRFPVYVEIDAESRLVLRLLLPIVSRVETVASNVNGGFDVELRESHGRHTIRADHPDFTQLTQTLETARLEGGTVIVTEDPDTHEIFDVRRDINPPANGNASGSGADESILAAAPTVTEQDADDIFRAMHSVSCVPKTPSAGCIPFLYPDDGCWGRAHEMCRLIAAAGKPSDKVWIYGRLKVNTKNNPTCSVEWNWHVAPRIAIRSSAGDTAHVIDPSLFPSHVSQAAWVAVQGDTNAQVVTSDARVFYRRRDGTTELDPDFKKTSEVLDTYRDALRLRSVGVAGPPPYRNCRQT